MAQSKLKKAAQTGQTDNSAASYSANTKLFPASSLSTYSWNLPPHKWSLPVAPSSDPLIVDTAKASSAAVKERDAKNAYRRGRIYYFSRVDARFMNSKDPNLGGEDPRYGFQFLWNPEAVTTSVAVNLDITPTVADKFVKVVGAFPSGEYLTINVVLDRTNDFFAIKAVNRVTKEFATNAYDDYKDGGILEASLTGTTGVNRFTEKLNQLRKKGTLADIEYLYKAINGPGWQNVATGDESSDIGFLSPTLLKIDLGPISYIGYVQNLTVNHISFTPSMIPIRSTVAIQFNLMATAGLSTGGQQ
jgi:hypothetical protein